ncbi:hypothetical protein KRP22_002381 [Phytophthora ramorum]|nr:Kinesin-like protein KIF22 [Phytophthora ramorum]
MQLSVVDPSTLTLLAPETDPIDYHFAKCYDESTTQRTLYQLEVSPAVNGVFAGLDTMVLACGAPGAGKTFTMEGNERSVGIIPRCIRRLFQVADALHYVCIVSVSYTKVFNDRVQDLLATETADGSVDLLGLTESRVGNLQEFTALYQRGRSVSAAKFEQKSCWSLSILTVRVLTKNKAGGEPHDGKLHFIDMAGYGVNRPTGNNGLSLKERGERDNSLAKVMAMANGKDTSGSCRPFRESNLTQLLRSSLDGCGHTIMLFNVSPSATTYKETVQTLSCARDAQDGLLSQNLPAPVATVEMKPELLAKDLVRVAIAFEKKRRLATAFCIFKRANHVLPKKSAKLTERLASLEDECAAVADQLPPQEMLTASYMVKVLENDLMSVLNDGSTKELTELYAIGSKRAELVRDERPYQKLQELQKVSGVSANVVTKLYEHHTHWENHQ